MAGAALYLVGFNFGKYGYATVAFFLGAKPVVFITGFLKNAVVYIFLLGLVFLDTDYISGLSFQSFHKPFLHSRPQAIDIIGNDFHIAANVGGTKECECENAKFR